MFPQELRMCSNFLRFLLAIVILWNFVSIRNNDIRKFADTGTCKYSDRHFTCHRKGPTISNLLISIHLGFLYYPNILFNGFIMIFPVKKLQIWLITNKLLHFRANFKKCSNFFDNFLSYFLLFGCLSALFC